VRETGCTHAAGGMVGLKTEFAIFISSAYLSLHKYLKKNGKMQLFSNGERYLIENFANDLEPGFFQLKPFRFHCLGVHSAQNRFVIHFLQCLFSCPEYTNDPNTVITYDTADFFTRAFYKRAEIKNYIMKFGERLIDAVYFEEFKEIYERNNKIIGRKKENSDYLHPIAISVQMCLDEFLIKLIVNCDVVRRFRNDEDIKKIVIDIENVINPDDPLSMELNTKFFDQIEKSLQECRIFHNWLISDKTDEGLDKAIIEFIRKANVTDSNRLIAGKFDRDKTLKQKKIQNEVQQLMSVLT
jgi:hypothetical protein